MFDPSHKVLIYPLMFEASEIDKIASDTDTLPSVSAYGPTLDSIADWFHRVHEER